MTEKQGTEFDLWFEQHMDPELTLTPGDKELCRHAWQAALSHAEGEAPFAYCFTDVNGRPTEFTDGPEHAAPEDWRVITPLFKGHPAPQVPVPEMTPEMVEAGANAVMVTDSAAECAEKVYRAMLAAAPTAPAGEPDDSDICEQVELPHVLAWADGIRGDMWAEYADRITDEEARVAQAVWAAHTEEQPVSDPDGLPEPGRREAEQAYINGAFDYARDPIGSRDWVLFWNGWQARDKSAPSPDEREIHLIGYTSKHEMAFQGSNPAPALNACSRGEFNIPVYAHAAQRGREE